jgi:hypothetical protein
VICSLLVKNVPSTLVPQSNEKQELMRVDLVFPLVSKTRVIKISTRSKLMRVHAADSHQLLLTLISFD